MRTRQFRSSRLSGATPDDHLLRDEITADVLEICITAARLMSRLTDNHAAPKTGRRNARRRPIVKPGV